MERLFKLVCTAVEYALAAVVFYIVGISLWPMICGYTQIVLKYY